MTTEAVGAGFTIEELARLEADIYQALSGKSSPMVVQELADILGDLIGDYGTGLLTIENMIVAVTDDIRARAYARRRV